MVRALLGRVLTHGWIPAKTSGSPQELTGEIQTGVELPGCAGFVAGAPSEAVER